MNGLKQMLSFLDLIMRKNVTINMYQNVDTYKMLRPYAMYIGTLLKPPYISKINNKRKYDKNFNYNIELNHIDDDKNKIILNLDKLFTKRFIQINFHCSYATLDYITRTIIVPWGQNRQYSSNTIKSEEGYMLQPPEKSDSNYKELMKRYWYEYNQRNQS